MTNYITKNDWSEIKFTLNESITISNPVFMLQIESKVDYTTKDLLLDDDYSWNTDRFNEYMIEEVPLVDEDLLNLKVNLELGQYNFYVWQCATASINTTTDNIIESGQIRVIE